MSEDLLKEIDADIRAEKFHELTRRYAKIVAVIAVIILIAVGIWQFMAWQKQKKLDEASATYLQIVQQVSPSSGLPVDQQTVNTAIDHLHGLSDHAPQSIRVLAQLKQAALLANQGKLKEASQIWDAIKGDTTASSDFRSFAGLLWIQHHLDNEKPELLQKRISELSGQQTPWRSLLRECEGLLDLRTGKTVEARQVFGKLSTDADASPGLRKRANLMLQVIAKDDGDKDVNSSKATAK